MVGKRFFKWSLLLPILLLALATVGMVIYILLPTVIGSLVAAPGSGNICDSPSDATGSSVGLSSALSGLCMTSKSFLGVIIMVVIMLAGVSTWISAFLTIIDAYTSSKLNNVTKALWIMGAALISYPVAVLYYFMEVRKRAG
jgi:hypothetical protein